jgi:hypothetical protein
MVPEVHYCIKGNSTWPETKLNDGLVSRSICDSVCIYINGKYHKHKSGIKGTQAKDE